VVHSEFNGSETEPVHFFQIWIEPARHGIAPSYEQKLFAEEERRGKLRVVVAPGGRDGALDIHQDALLYSGIVEPGQTLAHPLAPGRAAWIQVARGMVEVNGNALSAGDGAAIEEEELVRITAGEETEILLFDLR